jgi:hypothetical protein|tara:strand:- start:667 stop:903 length:237 start_codon:yes stop_codon:yes gene_type:complete
MINLQRLDLLLKVSSVTKELQPIPDRDAPSQRDDADLKFPKIMRNRSNLTGSHNIAPLLQSSTARQSYAKFDNRDATA